MGKGTIRGRIELAISFLKKPETVCHASCSAL